MLSQRSCTLAEGPVEMLGFRRPYHPSHPELITDGSTRAPGQKTIFLIKNPMTTEDAVATNPGIIKP